MESLHVLHTLRCMGASSVARIAAAAGVDTTDAQSELIDLAVDGLVARAAGEFGGWSLTDVGRTAHAKRVADELVASGARALVEGAYERFLVLNPKLLDVCTAWQLQTIGGSMTANDHSDPVYDGRVLDRLEDLHRKVEGILDDLTGSLPRFERYRARLSRALDRANGGQIDAVSDNMDSYHSVWFQLHEDLLVTLGLRRES